MHHLQRDDTENKSDDVKRRPMYFGRTKQNTWNGNFQKLDYRKMNYTIVLLTGGKKIKIVARWKLTDLKDNINYFKHSRPSMIKVTADNFKSAAR